MRMTFRTVAVGQQFVANGNLCLKVSSRTARLLAYDRVFYFRELDLVTTV